MHAGRPLLLQLLKRLTWASGRHLARTDTLSDSVSVTASPPGATSSMRVTAPARKRTPAAAQRASSRSRSRRRHTLHACMQCLLPVLAHPASNGLQCSQPPPAPLQARVRQFLRGVAWMLQAASHCQCCMLHAACSRPANSMHHDNTIDNCLEPILYLDVQTAADFNGNIMQSYLP